MTTLLWILGVAVGWLVLAGLVGTVVGTYFRRLDERAGEDG